MAKQEQDRTEKAEYHLKSLLADCGIDDPQGRTIMEIGFKSGHFLHQCRLMGMEPVGLEVQQQYCDYVQRRLPDLRVMCYEGRVFPVDDQSVDIVASFQVLEHVESVEAIIRESMRVLKPGGIMYHICPNYNSFYEGHFEVIWWPFLTRATGRTYLKLLRKYKPSYEALNIIKPVTVRQIIKQFSDQAQIISMGKNQFEQRFTLQQANKVRHKLLRNILYTMLRFPAMSRFPIKLISSLKWYYPMTVIVRKK